MQLCQTHKEHIEHRLSKNTQKQANLEKRKKEIKDRRACAERAERTLAFAPSALRPLCYVMLPKFTTKKCCKIAKSSKKQQKLAERCQKVPKGAKRCQKLPTIAKSCQKQPKVAQKLPNVANSSSSSSSGLVWSGWLHIDQFRNTQSYLWMGWMGWDISDNQEHQSTWRC